MYVYLENNINKKRYEASCDVCRNKAIKTTIIFKLITTILERKQDKKISNKPLNFLSIVVDSNNKQVTLFPFC